MFVLYISTRLWIYDKRMMHAQFWKYLPLDNVSIIFIDSMP